MQVSIAGKYLVYNTGINGIYVILVLMVLQVPVTTVAVNLTTTWMVRSLSLS